MSVPEPSQEYLDQFDRERQLAESIVDDALRDFQGALQAEVLEDLRLWQVMYMVAHPDGRRALRAAMPLEERQRSDMILRARRALYDA